MQMVSFPFNRQSNLQQTQTLYCGYWIQPLINLSLYLKTAIPILQVTLSSKDIDKYPIYAYAIIGKGFESSPRQFGTANQDNFWEACKSL